MWTFKASCEKHRISTNPAPPRVNKPRTVPCRKYQRSRAKHLGLQRGSIVFVTLDLQKKGSFKGSSEILTKEKILWKFLQSQYIPSAVLQGPNIPSMNFPLSSFEGTNFWFMDLRRFHFSNKNFSKKNHFLIFKSDRIIYTEAKLRYSNTTSHEQCFKITTNPLVKQT